MLTVDDPREISFPKMSLRLPSMIPGCVDSCQHFFFFFAIFTRGCVLLLFLSMAQHRVHMMQAV